MQIWHEPLSRAAWLESAEEQTCQKVRATLRAFPRKRLKRRQIIMERQGEPLQKEGFARLLPEVAVTLSATMQGGLPSQACFCPFPVWHSVGSTTT